MQVIKTGNLLLRFILEICMLVSLGYWGFQTGDQMVLKVVLGIGCPAVAATIWGFFLAPAASRRLPEPWRFTLEILLFGAAVLALYTSGQPILSVIFGMAYALNKLLLVVWKQ